MKILLDTHVLIWLGLDAQSVPPRVRQSLIDAEQTFVSVVSGWEYGIKRSQRPEELTLRFDELIAKAPVTPLDLEFAVHTYSEGLPPIHRDPFDRMLIAQALHHDLILVTSDRKISLYPVKTIW